MTAEGEDRGAPTAPASEAPEAPIGRFAGNGGTRYFHGTIDEVRVLTVARTAEQVQAEYQEATEITTLAVSVTVRNVAPTAEAGRPYTGNEGIDITLSAAASSDSGNDTVTYEWDLDHNGTYETTGLTATFNSTADGTFLVGLRVTDDDGPPPATGTATVTVRNVAPHADAGGPYIVELGTGVGLDASGSTDPGHDIASYAWDLDSDGQFDDATGVMPTVSWASLVGLELAYPADPATGLHSNTIRVLVTDRVPG